MRQRPDKEFRRARHGLRPQGPSPGIQAGHCHGRHFPRRKNRRNGPRQFIDRQAAR